jgi:uncharacterized SAM-binding protein YcdF (DUF218 family)
MELQRREPRPQAREESDWDAWLTFGLTLLVSLCSLGIANLLALQRVLAAARLPQSDSEFRGKILIFGKRLSDERPDADYLRRLDRALDKYESPRRQQLVLLGGRTRDASLSEAEAGASYLRARTVESDLNLHIESESTHTIENLRCLREVLSPEERDRPLLLVTNRYHLARVRLVARSLGLRYRLDPAETRLGLDPATLGRLAIESWFYLWFNVGKHWAKATGNRRMLERVT